MNKEKIKKILSSEVSIILILAILCVVVTVVTPLFASPKNLVSVLQRTASTGILAIGMTFVIATGGIDLSVGGQATLMGITAASCLTCLLYTSTVVNCEGDANAQSDQIDDFVNMGCDIIAIHAADAEAPVSYTHLVSTAEARCVNIKELLEDIKRAKYMFVSKNVRYN